ncbi:MAG: O-antigen ligase family protein [Terriglobales bacterium]
MSLTLLASLTFVLIIAAVIFVRPWLGLSLLVLLGAAGKLAILPEFDWDLMDVVAAITAWSALVYLLFQRKGFRASALDAPLLLLGGAVLLNLPRAAGPADFISGLRFLVLLVIYFLGVLLLDTQEKVRSALVALVVAAGSIAALSLVLFVTGTNRFSWLGTQVSYSEGGLGRYRVGGPFEQPNTFAQIMVIAVPLGLALVLATRGRQRWLFGALTSASLICAFLTQSRSAVLGVLFGLALVLYATRKARSRAFSVAAALMLCAVALGSSLGTAEQLLWRLNRRGVAAEVQPESSLNRRKILVASLEVLSENPLGVGYGQARRFIGAKLGVTSKSAHNILLGWGVEFGILGLVAGCWLFIRQVRMLAKVAKTSHDNVGLLAAGCLGAVSATWIHNMFHATLHSGFVWIFFAAASAVCLLSVQVPRQVPLRAGSRMPVPA